MMLHPKAAPPVLRQNRAKAEHERHGRLRVDREVTLPHWQEPEKLGAALGPPLLSALGMPANMPRPRRLVSPCNNLHKHPRRRTERPRPAARFGEQALRRRRRRSAGRSGRRGRAHDGAARAERLRQDDRAAPDARAAAARHGSGPVPGGAARPRRACCRRARNGLRRARRRALPAPDGARQRAADGALPAAGPRSASTSASRSSPSSCGFPASALARYPSELSGGQKQRVGADARAHARPRAAASSTSRSARSIPLVRAELQDELARDLRAARQIRRARHA